MGWESDLQKIVIWLFLMHGGLISSRNKPWVKMLEMKYGTGNDLLPKKEKKQNISQVWRDICTVWAELVRNYQWMLGMDGMQGFGWTPR